MSTIYSFKRTSALFVETRSDGGGVLELTCGDVEEFTDLFVSNPTFKSRINPIKRPLEYAKTIEAIAKGGWFKHTCVGTNKKNSNRCWYKHNVMLDRKFSEPYIKAIKRVTGHDIDVPIIIQDEGVWHFSPVGAMHNLRLTDDGCFHATMYVTSEDWNNQKAADRSERQAAEYLTGMVGYRPHHREFIPCSNGTYKLNPDYGSGKRLPVRPTTASAFILNTLFSWWRTNHANKQQLDILERCDQLDRASFCEPDYKAKQRYESAGFGAALYYRDPEGVVNWSSNKDSKDKTCGFIKWEDFARLGKEDAGVEATATS